MRVGVRVREKLMDGVRVREKLMDGVRDGVRVRVGVGVRVLVLVGVLVLVALVCNMRGPFISSSTSNSSSSIIVSRTSKKGSSFSHFGEILGVAKLPIYPNGDSKSTSSPDSKYGSTSSNSVDSVFSFAVLARTAEAKNSSNNIGCLTMSLVHNMCCVLK